MYVCIYISNSSVSIWNFNLCVRLCQNFRKMLSELCCLHSHLIIWKTTKTNCLEAIKECEMAIIVRERNMSELWNAPCTHAHTRALSHTCTHYENWVVVCIKKRYSWDWMPLVSLWTKRVQWTIRRYQSELAFLKSCSY